MTGPVSITLDRRELNRTFDVVLKDQLPYASAVALTRSARDGVEATRDRVRRVFTIRKTELLRRFRSVRAEKRDWPNLRASVGSLDAFWNDQEYGAIRKPRAGGTLSIPTRLIRPTKAKSITKLKRPRQLIQNGQARVDGDLIRKAGKLRKKDQRSIFYLRRASVQIKEALGATETVHQTVRAAYPGHFAREMKAAVKSRRARAGSFTSEQGRRFYLKARALL